MTALSTKFPFAVVPFVLPAFHRVLPRNPNGIQIARVRPMTDSSYSLASRNAYIGRSDGYRVVAVVFRVYIDDRPVHHRVTRASLRNRWFPLDSFRVIGVLQWFMSERVVCNDYVLLCNIFYLFCVSDYSF